MYTTKLFKNENRDELIQFIRANNFGLLISTVDNRPWATHIPFMIDTEGKTLSTHVARGNKQWKSILGQEILIVFQGPHSYISSSWYDHENVPTWNYISIHAYGNAKIIEGEELKNELRHLVNHHEKDSAKPISVDTMTPSYLAAEMRAIVGLEIEIKELQATFKLSQNRDTKNYESIIQHLENSTYLGAAAVASEMKKRKP